MIRIIAGGKPSKNWLLEGVNEYERRLKKPFDVKWDFFEEEKLATYLEKWPFKPSDFVILLDERGENLSSPEISRRLEACFNGAKIPVFIIGGAYGVSETAREKSDLVWSFGAAVFPHELIRLNLIEQIYRAQEIARGGSYHHM